MSKLNREDQERRAIEFVTNAYKSFSNRAGLEELWRRLDAMYNLHLEKGGKGSYEGASKLFPPEARRALQTIADFIIDVLFPPTSDWFRIKPVDDDADPKNADIYKRISSLQNEKIGIRAKAIKAVHRWLKYGFLLVRTPYVYKDKYIIAEEKERSQFKQMLKSFFRGVTKKWDNDFIPEKSAKVMYDNIDFQVKSPWNMYWNYNIPWCEQQIVIEKIENVTASHLRTQKNKIYKDFAKNVDNVIAYLEGDGKNEGNESDVDQKYPHMGEITGLNGSFSDGKAKATLLQADCYFDIDQDGYDELCIITVALTKTNTTRPNAELIRLELNDCELQELPVHFVPWDELEDMSLGIGVLQIAEKDQKSLNDFTNQIMDDISEILNCTRVYDSQMVDEGQNLNTWPRKTITIKGDPKGVIDFIRPPNIVNEGMAAVNMAKANIQNGTRANVSFQGLAARYDTTATEYTQQGSAASRGIMSQIKNFEDNIIKPYLKFQYSYNLQYLTRENIIKICGRKAAQAMLSTDNPMEQKGAKEVIMGDYDFIPLGVTQTENKIIRGQQLINALNIAIKVNQVTPGAIPIDELWNKIWDTIGDGDSRIYSQLKKDSDMLLPEDENILISQGADLDVHPLDDDAEHAQIHVGLELTPEFQKNMEKHLKKHDLSAQRKMMAQQAQMIQQAIQSGQANPGAQVRQQPDFAPKAPMPGNNGGVPGIVRPPAGVV